MKQRLLLILILTMLAQFSCTPSTVACPTPTTESKLLMNVEDGYCLLYPAEFSAGTAPYILVLNPVGPGPGDVLGHAWVSIDMESADGRTAAQVVDTEITSTEFVGLDLNIERTEIQVDGEQAIVVDGLPGPDAWRRVFIVHGERLYILTFLPWLPNEDDGSQTTPLENLYETIISSLHFLPPTKSLPTPVPVWGADNLPPALSFEYPLDGAVLDYEGDYHFKVTEISGAEAYRWSFTQNGFVVWDNLRDELGTTVGGCIPFSMEVMLTVDSNLAPSRSACVHTRENFLPSPPQSQLCSDERVVFLSLRRWRSLMTIQTLLLPLAPHDPAGCAGGAKGERISATYSIRSVARVCTYERAVMVS